MSDFYTNLAKDLAKEGTSVLSDGTSSAEFSGWIDTGSYALNAQVSGSMYGGMADNKVTGLAGEEATGKTFFALALLQSFQKMYDNAGGFHYDTESATTKEMMESRNIDSNRVLISEPETVEDFRTHAYRTLDKYMAVKGDKPRMMMILDSLGQLPTMKEVEDIDAAKNVRDMTRTQIIKGAFRALTLKLAKAKVPMIVTNHTYQTMELYSKKVMSGGGGLKFAASTILFLGRNVDKDQGRGEGVLINCFLAKSRFTKPETTVKLRLNYATGLDRYYGLLDIADEYGIFEKSGTQYLIDGKKYFAKTINANPEKFYTTEVMERLEEACAKKFKFGAGDIRVNDEDEDDDGDE